jgi:hypothetical protein
MKSLKRNQQTLPFFPPWFLTKDVLRKINALVPYYYHTRFRFYFDRYGCIRCGRNDIEYCSGGLCKVCNGLINDRLKRTDLAMKKKYGSDRGVPCASFLKRLNSARELLADFRKNALPADKGEYFGIKKSSLPRRLKASRGECQLQPDVPQ